MSKNKKRKKELLAKMTERQKLFCTHYINNGMNATKAAEKAGYAEKNARSTGYENTTKPYMKEYIDILLQEKCDRINMKGDEVLMRSSMLARANVADFYKKDEDGNIKLSIDPLDYDLMYCVDEITTKTNSENEVIETKIKLADRQKALKDAGNHNRINCFNNSSKSELDIGDNLKEALQGNELAAKLAFLLSSQETK